MRLRTPGLFLVMALLGGWAVPYLLYNDRRPLVGEGNVRVTSRADQYFRGNPGCEESYVAAAAFLRKQGYREVGLVFGYNDWEYPLWMLLTHFDPRKCRVEHLAYDAIAARAVTERYAAFRPPVVVRFNHPPSPVELHLRGRTYHIAWVSDALTIYVATDE